MIKESLRTRLLTSVEKDGKIIGLHWANEMPLRALINKYGKKNVTTESVVTTSKLAIISDDERCRRIGRVYEHQELPKKWKPNG